MEGELSRGGGQPLPETDRDFMERRFGFDFSKVRVHTNSNAIQMSRKLNAQAFTHGSNIYFGAGRYNSGTSAGRRLLAHELTHVVQQRANHLPCIQRKDYCPPGGPYRETDPNSPSSSPPLIYKTGDPQLIDDRAIRPSVGYAQQLLNIFLGRYAVGKAECIVLTPDNIAHIERYRNNLSNRDRLTVDCFFWNNTDRATRMFQICKGLNEDGKIGERTWPVLEAAAVGPFPKTVPQAPAPPAPAPGQSPLPPQTQKAKVKKVTVTKNGSAPYDFEMRRGGGTDLGYHFGYVFKSPPGRLFPLPVWYANLRFLVTVEVNGLVDLCTYKQTIAALWSTGKSKYADETLPALKQRPLTDQNWVKVVPDKVKWQDAPGITTDSNKTPEDLPFWFGGEFTQSAVGEDNIQVGVRWKVYYEVDEHGNWREKHDDLPVSKSHPYP
jgi:hypothetical protein